MKINIIFLLSFIASGALAQVTYSSVYKDVNYADDGMSYHNMDIYIPQAKKIDYPVIVVVYGSAWFANNLKDAAIQTMAKPLLDAGFAVVAPNHRSSNEAKFPAQINDIKAAIRFIRGQAKKYNLDTYFVGITGYSSGGHLAALAGTSSTVKNFTVGKVTQDIEGSLGNYNGYSSKVHAVVDWFGPTNLWVIDSCRGKDTRQPNTPEEVLIGGKVDDNYDKCALLDPAIYIDKKTPPFLILHGDRDVVVPACQSELLYSALQKAKVPSQYVLVNGGQHGPGMFTDQYFKMMTDFFRSRLTTTR
jgi:acetyl esterase/lipase